MDILEKYKRLRPRIADGDLILFHGTGVVAKTIQKCDSAYYNHIGVVVSGHGALFIVDANSNGVQADRLSMRIEKYKGGDFSILQPFKDNAFAMSALLKKSDIKDINYDFKNGIKELINRKFGSDLKIKLRSEHAICSSNVAQYAIDLEIVTKEFCKLRIAFPQDFVRYINLENATIIN